jgi:hypothetical protein
MVMVAAVMGTEGASEGGTHTYARRWWQPREEDDRAGPACQREGRLAG